MSTKVKVSRAQMMRETRRASQFAKFRLVQLNLVPLVDTFVSIVFFALTTATVGELAPIAGGVTLPEAGVGTPAHQEITVAVASQPAQITVNNQRVLGVDEARTVQSNFPDQPLVIPALYARLKASADSIRQDTNGPANQSVNTPLAIQGDRVMRYDLLSRVLQTARMAGFKNVTLQVRRTGIPGESSAPQS